MSTKENVELPSRVLVDSDVFFSYLVNDKLCVHSGKLIERANEGFTRLAYASELYDDIITALSSDLVGIQVIVRMLGDLRRLPHEALSTVDIAEEAVRLYSQHGGSRKLHYFDSFHVATAKQYDPPLVSSDRYVLRNSDKLGIKAIDLRTI